MASTDIVHVTSGNAKFANKFYNILSRREGNVFFSPLSAHTVLAMAYQGAAKETAKQFASTLQVPDHKVAANGYNTIMSYLNKIQDVTLHIANKIFVMNGFPLKDTFKNTTTKLFLSETESVDFGDNVNSADKINGWVENKTNSKIKDLIAPDSLDSLTRLVLVNAVYFKGAWDNKFDKENTVTAPFFITPENKVDCQMMHNTSDYRYRIDEELDANIVELPYKNKNVSMVVILPNAIDGITKLEEKLMNVDLTTLTQNMRYDEVQLSLPKFKMETTMDLKPILEEMGLGTIFDRSNADFSEIAETDEQLYVSKVVQKAFIEVNEEGAEAAAATGMKMMAFCLKLPFEFVANHPFIVLLQVKHENSVNILFYGKIVKPEYV
ncbi:hypothetical protein ILUMI_12016 [Ignelater luminosus]|uniref:Serpin domain-containing protein n=1 Tax=Ignelater luminosus TaxID=2038154 RepID=A0A8K0G9Y7_IGNLU|nr:hypothetical protein ILUMI_12016 [Ignelater luminosus]